MFFITGCLSRWDITWADQINRQHTEDFSGVAHPPCVERPQGTKWTAIKEDEWGIWISHPGSPHYMSYSFLNPHQHCRDFQCGFITAQARLQSPKRKKKILFLYCCHLSAHENKGLLIYEIWQIPLATPNVKVTSTETSYGRGNTLLMCHPSCERFFK